MGKPLSRIQAGDNLSGRPVPAAARVTAAQPASMKRLGPREWAGGRMWLLYPVAFLIGRATIAGDEIFLGYAFFAALVISRLNPRAAALAGAFTLTALLAVLPPGESWHGLVMLAAIAFAARLGKPAKKPWAAALRVGIAVLIVRVALLYGGGFDSPYGYVVAGIEAVLTSGGALVFARGLRILPPVSPVDSLQGRESRIAVAALAVASVGGLSGATLGEMSVPHILAMFLLVNVTHLAGSGAGASFGVALGLMSQIGQWNPPIQAAVYATAGLVGGLFRHCGKWGTVAGCGIGALFLHPGLGQPLTLVWPAAGAGLAFIAFLAVPIGVFRTLGAMLPGTDTFFEAQAAAQRRLKTMIGARIKELSGIFTRLAQSFEDAPSAEQETAQNDVYSVLESVALRACGECRSHERCWEEHFYETYSELFDLLALAESKGEATIRDLRGRLGRACIQQYQLLSTINSSLQVCRVDRYWQKRLHESRSLVSSQLRGVAGLMEGLAGQVKLDVEFHEDTQSKVTEALRRLGLDPRSVSVCGSDDKQIEIRIEKKPCGGRNDCGQVVAPFLSRLLGRGFAVWQRNCLHDPGRACLTVYCPRRVYSVGCAVRQLAKDGNMFCGDSHASFETREGRFVMLLSDGVGTGPRAAMESRTAVSVLQHLITSGIDRDFAVQVVNNILHLRTSEETFSTLDLTMINLFSGEGEFIKIGAAPTYIKRGRDVVILRSNSLPVGIFLNRVEVDATTRNLQPGDLVVMVSDGVVDSLVTDDPTEDWIAQALNRIEIVGVDALADYLMQRARHNGKNSVRDDMTVAVMQLSRGGPAECRTPARPETGQPTNRHNTRFAEPPTESPDGL